MKIPLAIETQRFYVATSMKSAFSSWNTIDDARACIERFELFGARDPRIRADGERIIGIVRVSPRGRVLVMKTKCRFAGVTA